MLVYSSPRSPATGFELQLLGTEYREEASITVSSNLISSKLRGKITYNRPHLFPLSTKDVDVEFKSIPLQEGELVQEERVRQGDFVQFRERVAKLKGLSFNGKNIEKEAKECVLLNR